MTTAFESPILVTGLPRSGTSLVASVLAACGAWVGTTTPPSPENRRGNFEHVALRENLLKPYLRRLGADPLGLRSFPVVDPIRTSGHVWREHVRDVLRIDRYPGGTWLYKDAKLVLCWKQWAAAFPDARWVIVRRRTEDVIASCLAAEPMTRQLGTERSVWERWAEEYISRVEALRGARGALIVWPERFLRGETRELQGLIETLGLTWDAERVAECVDRSLWHHREEPWATETS